MSIQAENPQSAEPAARELNLTFVIVSHDLAVISYMCERLMVMRNAEPVETLTREALRAGAVIDPYSRQLIAAS